jgi:RNA polymerase sigma factor (TIGR02999 family)
MGDVTAILASLETTGPEGLDRLFAHVYDELRQLAGARLAHAPPGMTLQSTALVHEAYLRMVGDGPQNWPARRHFFATAAQAMRRIVIERARAKGRIRRGGDQRRIGLECCDIAADEPTDALDLDEALARLAAEYPEHARLVELRYFGGLTLEQAAELLDVSRATADRNWAFARAWLFDALSSSPDPGTEGGR